MSSTPRKRTLLRPKWLLLHVFTIAVCCGMVWLGRWQWHQAGRHHGEIRNYVYAIQWWAFTAFAILMWTRIIHDHFQTGTPDEPAPEQQATPKYVAYEPPATTAVEEDPERIRFNAYLAKLNEPDREDSA